MPPRFALIAARTSVLTGGSSSTAEMTLSCRADESPGPGAREQGGDVVGGGEPSGETQWRLSRGETQYRERRLLNSWLGGGLGTHALTLRPSPPPPDGTAETRRHASRTSQTKGG